MKTSQAEWAGIRRKFLDRAARQGLNLSLRDRVWAVTQKGDWIALPGTSDSPVADRWWLGCDPDKLRSRRPLGIVLLCQARAGALHAIGLPGHIVRELEGRLSRNERQIFFNVVRRGNRFLLQLVGGEEFDVTRCLEDLSWIAGGQPTDLTLGKYSTPREGSSVIRESTGGSLDRADSGEPETGRASALRFFAVVKNGALHPLDDIELKPGSLYLVEASEADAVPGNRSLRRILARGGPADLPADLAERHDAYSSMRGIGNFTRAAPF